jgi:hypothetical protein
MPAAIATLPTLSLIHAWSTEHLQTAATGWSHTAQTWEQAFTTVHREAANPGGTSWEGAGSDAALLRTGTDRRVVIGAVDSLHSAADAARFGAEEIGGAQLLALQAVDKARAAGFTVGDDLSVSSRHTDGPPGVRAVREAQAERLATTIRSRAEALLAVDAAVAAKVSAAITGVSTAQFADTPVTPPPSKEPEFEAVDYHIVKEAPPQPTPPPPPDPQPGPLPPISNAEDVRKVLDPLPNGGEWGPNNVGKEPGIKEVWDAGSVKRMWDWLTRNAAEIQKPRYDGAVRVLPDGTEIGLRQSSKGWGDTIDVWYPDASEDRKIHTPYKPYFPSLIGAPPELPPIADPAPLPLPPPNVGHAPVALPPSGIFDPNGLPPWLQNPSPAGFSVQPSQPPIIMPGVELPAAPAPATPPSPDGSSILPEIGSHLADAGEAVGAGVVTGVVIVGTLLAEVFTPSGQIAR